MDERLQALIVALKNADAAGDADAARRLAAAIVQLRAQIQSQPAGVAAEPPQGETFEGAGAGGTWGPLTMREQGRAAAPGGVGAGLQGFGSFMLGLGTPVTAAVTGAAAALPGGRPAMSPGEALEYARGIREGAYEKDPWTYRAGAVAGMAGGVGLVGGALKVAPKAVSTVFALQEGQTVKNLGRLAGMGAAAAGVTAASEQGAEAVPLATAVGAVAGPVGAGLVRGLGRLFMSANNAAIRILAKRGGNADELAAFYNEFVRTHGRAPRLVEIMRREGAEEMGEISRSKVGVEAGRIFRKAEEQAARDRPGELSTTTQRSGPTSNVPAEEALLEPIERETAEFTGRRVAGTHPSASAASAQIGRRNVQMDRVIAEIGDHNVPVSHDMLGVIQGTDVWSSLDGALRRRIIRAVEAGETSGATNLPLRTWDMIRLELGAKADDAGVGQIYKGYRDRVRDYVSSAVPEYGAALREFGRRSDVARGTTAGRAALTKSTQEFAAEVRSAGGGTPTTPQRPDVRVSEQAGMRGGARMELVAAFSGPQDKAARFMERLARDPSLRANLREVLSPNEIRTLEQLGDAYGFQLRVVEGVKQGARVAAKSDPEAFRAAVAEAGRSPEGAEAVQRGARGALAAEAVESPAGAVRTAARLAQDLGLQRRIEIAMGAGERSRLETVGTTAFRAAENLSLAATARNQAAARTQAAAAQVREVLTAIVAASGRASGALRVNFANDVLQRTRMSEKAAARVAEMATNPAQVAAVINLLRRRGVQPAEIAKMYRNAAIAAGIIVGHKEGTL